MTFRSNHLDETPRWSFDRLGRPLPDETGH